MPTDWPFDVAQAIALAEEAHAGQVDKAGRPYIEHVLRVADAVAPSGPTTQMAAALHDVVEDTSWTLDELAVAGVPAQVVNAVDALTHRPGEPYEAAVRRAAANPIARIVKLADNADNSSAARLSALDPVAAERLREKYARARAILESGA